ncbi:MAG: hypoxanthine phosphoribosyltransferase [Chloroflexia bacterium]
MLDDIDHILVSEEQIKNTIADLGRTLTDQYAGEELVLIGVLKGAIIFIVDLARAINLPVKLDFMAVASYGASTQTSGIVRILKDLDSSIEGKHVLIVEDIIDSGLTLKYIIETLQSRNPSSLKVCALLNKPARRQVDVQVDYICFDIPDEFVVGYGLDFNQIYRNLPFVGVLKPALYTGGEPASEPVSESTPE